MRMPRAFSAAVIARWPGYPQSTQSRHMPRRPGRFGLADERTRFAGGMNSRLRCRGARSSKSVTVEGPRLVVEAAKQQKDADLTGDRLESCFIRIAQSRMTSKEQRRSHLGEATPHRNFPLTLHRPFDQRRRQVKNSLRNPLREPRGFVLRRLSYAFGVRNFSR